MNRFLPTIEDEHEGFKFNWSVTIKPGSYPKSTEKMTCSYCMGNCRSRVHFGVDDAEDCYVCNNTGQVDKPVKWHPKPPKDLVDALHKVVVEYWNKQQNDKFELVG
ncbi:MAG TPA: hypothetical protein VIR31_02530 [Nitrososphaeraceae archaeon]